MISIDKHIAEHLQEVKRLDAIRQKYPDAMMLMDDERSIYAPSAREAATDLTIEPCKYIDDGGHDMLVARAPVNPTGDSKADFLPLSIVAGKMPVREVLAILQRKHPEAYQVLVQVVSTGDPDPIPF